MKDLKELIKELGSENMVWASAYSHVLKAEDFKNRKVLVPKICTPTENK